MVGGVMRVKNLLNIGSVVNCEAIREHSHSVWEMVYYTGGAVTLTMDGRDHALSPGIFVCQPPHRPHGEQGRDRFANYYFSVGSFDLLPSRELIVPDTADGAILNQIRQLHYVFNTRPHNVELLCDGLLNMIVQYTLSQLRSSRTNPYVEKTVMLLLRNASNSAFRVSDLALEVPYSADYFRLLFKQEMGCTPVEYLNSVRLRSAMDLLRSSDREGGLPVSAVAVMCGFSDPLYFSRCFRKRTGMTPTQWMERRRQEIEPLPEGTEEK